MGVVVQRHGDVGVAHDVLQRFGIHTGVCHTGAERVSEGVRGDVGQLFLVMLVVLFHKVFKHTIVIKAHLRHPLTGKKQEVCVAVHCYGGFLAPVLQHPPKRLIDRLTHAAFAVTSFFRHTSFSVSPGTASRKAKAPVPRKASAQAPHKQSVSFGGTGSIRPMLTARA